MSARSRATEADNASVAFHIALTSIGVSTIEEALVLWGDVSTSPTKVTATSSRWLTRAISLVMRNRRMSRDLAVAYYRLVRALRTGKTIQGPTRAAGTHVTLGELRREFASLVDDFAPPPTPARAEPLSPSTERVDASNRKDEAGATPKSGLDSPDDNDSILIEELKRLDEEQDRLEALAEEEIRIALEALGSANLESKLSVVDDQQLASEADIARDDIHRQVGFQQAAAVERVVLDGGRGELWSLADQDARAIGYARISRTGTPCGWCAMLISRGAVYRSKKSATRAIYGDGDMYHDNCHCYAIPIFSQRQFNESALFELNRKYAIEWPRVTQGLGGKDAVSAWRKHIRASRAAPADLRAA